MKRELNVSKKRPKTTAKRIKELAQSEVPDPNKTAYTWLKTRVHKKNIAKPNHMFLVLIVTLPSGRTFKLANQVPIPALQNELLFNKTLEIGFAEMKNYIHLKGFETP